MRYNTNAFRSGRELDVIIPLLNLELGTRKILLLNPESISLLLLNPESKDHQSAMNCASTIFFSTCFPLQIEKPKYWTTLAVTPVKWFLLHIIPSRMAAHKAVPLPFLLVLLTWPQTHRKLIFFLIHNFFFIYVGIRVSLHVPRLIPRSTEHPANLVSM